MKNPDTGDQGPEGFTTTNVDEFLNELDSSSISPEIVNEVRQQLADVEDEQSSIIFIFTEGRYVVTGIHVHPAALDGKDGPILMRGAGDNLIIAAFSRNYIIRLLEESEELETYGEESAGLFPGLNQQEHAWMQQLEKMASLVRVELVSNPPEKWEDILEGNPE
jgi:hypothetical protein